MSTETVTRKLFTIDEFQQILDAGIFPPDTFFELIRGEIIEMPDPTAPHIGRVNKLTRVFTSLLQERAIVSVQNAVRIRKKLPMSRPRPDVAILKPLPELFGPFEPTPDDVLLLIEISDTSIRYDRQTKSSLYAEAEVPEYWILNIPECVLEVQTDPVEGKFRKVQLYKPGQFISPTRLPDVRIAVNDILN